MINEKRMLNTQLSRKDIIQASILLFFINLINFIGIFYGNYPMNDVDNNWGFTFKLYFAKQLQQGIFPLWNNLSFTGMPFCEQDAASSPLNIMVYLLLFLMKIFHNPYFAYSLIIMIQVFLMGLFTYIVTRKVFGLSALAAYLPAVIYMLNMGQMERVAWMPGGFMVAPILILCADRIAAGKIINYSILSGFLLALGFYLGCSMATAWSLLIFIYFLIYFIVANNSLNLISVRRMVISLMVSLGTFILLSASIIIPLIYHMSLYENLQARYKAVVLHNIFNLGWFKYAVSEVFLSNISGLSDYVSKATYDLNLFTPGFSDSLLSRFFFPGQWNYWSVLVLPLVPLFLFNRRLLTRKEWAIIFLIAIYYIHFFILSFNHVMFYELYFLAGHNLLTKLQLIMQLLGGLFIGVIFNKILTLNPQEKIRGLGITRLVSVGLLVFYGMINLIFINGILLYALLKEKIVELLAKSCALLIQYLPALQGVRLKYAHALEAKINDSAQLLSSHFLNSEFTVNYLAIFLTRLIMVIIFLKIMGLLNQQDRKSKAVFISVACIVCLIAIERINMLHLHCAFNQDAPKNFSQSYKEIEYVQKNLIDGERVAVVTNGYTSLAKYVSREYGIPLDSNNVFSSIHKEKFLQILNNFPENYRNGMPLMYIYNLPYGIPALSAFFTAVPSEIWAVYHHINLKSEYYAGYYKSLDEVLNGVLDIYSIDSSLVDMLGVKYILSSVPLESNKLKFILKGNKYFLYENKKSFPRVWLVDKYIVEKDRGKILGLMEQRSNELLVTAVSEDKLSFLDTRESQRVLAYHINTSLYNPNSISIKLDVNKNSLLVLSDTYFEDWHVSVNGVEKKIERVNYFLRGVPLGPGNNTVLFSFRPTLFFYSCTITILALVILLIGFFIAYFRKKAKLI